MRTRQAEVQGIDWGDGAIINCTWGGVLLADVLLRAIPEIGDLLHDRAILPDGYMFENELEGGEEQQWQKVTWHVQFECNQQETQEDGWYGASIPLDRAMDRKAEVLLAFDTNENPLPIPHGAPLRLIVPGVCGARSLKWLDTIRISTDESANHYQQRDYKILPPHVTDSQKAAEWWGKVPALMDMPVNSVVAAPCTPGEEQEEVAVKGGVLEVRGYAVPAGMDGPIVSVDVSLDDGNNQMTAQLIDDDKQASKWAWMRWRIELTREVLEKYGESVGPDKVKVTILSRATDAGGNFQQISQWNLRGVAYNGYGEARNVVLRFE